MPQAEAKAVVLAPEKSLPKKQRRVYDLLTSGKTPAEVAKQMKISVNGVYGHMRRIESAGLDLSEHRSRNGSSTIRRTRRRSTRRTSRNGQSPGVRDFLKTLDQAEANLSNEDKELAKTIDGAKATLQDAEKREAEVHNALLGIKDARNRVSGRK